MNQQRALKVEAGEAAYRFVCEGCQCEGDLGIPEDEHGPFGCPERCGATYIQTKDLDGNYVLTRVVCPVFEDDEPVFEELLDASEIED